MDKTSRKKKDNAEKRDAEANRPDQAPAEDFRKTQGPDIPSFTTVLFHKAYIHALLIVLLGFIAYSNTFTVPFQFDDVHLIVQNPQIKDFGKMFDIAGMTVSGKNTSAARRYIAYLTFALNYGLHGLDVTGYHIVNLMVHIINAVLVYILAVLMLGTPAIRGYKGPEERYPVYVPLFAALLFVSHPMQTQAVTYIAQRMASLSTLFYLLSLISYIKFRLSSKGVRRNIRYALSLIFAVAAMKTKETAFTLPLVVTLFECMFLEGKIKRRMSYLVPLLSTMLIIPATLLGPDKPVGEIIGGVSEATRVQTTLSRWDYLFTQFRVVVTYVRLLFLPVNQNLDYDYPVFHSFFDARIVSSFLFLTLIFGFGVHRLYRFKRPNPDTTSPTPYSLLTSFGIFWFFITLSVESGIIPIVDVIYEHRVYLPSVGAWIAAAALVRVATNKIERGWKTVKRPLIPALALVILIFSGATYARNTVWMDEYGLWLDVVKKSPYKARGHYNLGRGCRAEGLIHEAIRHYKIAVKLRPDHSDAHFNLGLIYLQKGAVDKAQREFETALRSNPNNRNAEKFLRYVSKNK